MADGGGHGGRERREADAYPGLPATRASLEHYTGLMPLGLHGGDGVAFGAVQIEEDVAGVLLSGEGVEVDVRIPPDCAGAENLRWRHTGVGKRSKCAHQGPLCACGSESTGPDTNRRAWPRVVGAWPAE